MVLARLREAQELASRRAADATLLQALTVELIQNAEAGVTLRSALVQLCDSLGLRGVCLLTSPAPTSWSRGPASRTEAEQVAHDLLDDSARRAPGRLVALREPGKPAAFPITTVDTAFGFVVADPGDREPRPRSREVPGVVHGRRRARR